MAFPYFLNKSKALSLANQADCKSIWKQIQAFYVNIRHYFHLCNPICGGNYWVGELLDYLKMGKKTTILNSQVEECFQY